MPELPEIETVKLQLQKYLVGQEISKLEQLHKKSVHGDLSLVKGKKITGIERKGKMLIINLAGDLDIAVHFKMSGQLVLVRSDKRQVTSRIAGGHPTLRQSSGQADIKNRIVGGHPTEDWLQPLPSKHTRAIFHLKSGDILYFNDQRIFGWVEINAKIKNQKSKLWKYLEKLGPEPWDITDSEFHKLISKRKKAIKLVLMDQEVISGTGNIYANEALWEARIHPQTLAKRLRYKDTEILRESLIKVLREGIKYGGATAADAKYINLDGMGGKYQEHFRTYDREGDPCLRCKTKIKKISLGGRGTYFCPSCQKI